MRSLRFAPQRKFSDSADAVDLQPASDRMLLIDAMLCAAEMLVLFTLFLLVVKRSHCSIKLPIDVIAAQSQLRGVSHG